MTEDSVTDLVSEGLNVLTNEGYEKEAAAIRAELAAERERYAKMEALRAGDGEILREVNKRYAKLEADYDKLTEMYERALREREDGP